MLVLSSVTDTEALGLVSVARYRAITRDQATPSDEVVSALVEAVHLVEEFLRRKLFLAEHTESQHPRQRRVLPSVQPVTAVVEGDVLDGNEIVLGTVPGFGRSATFVYKGGYTADNLPPAIERAIAMAARDEVMAATTTAPFGAQSVRVGDVAVTYGPNGAGAGSGGLAPRLSRSIIRWRVKFS